jgi:hypothetical protein
MAPDSSSHWSPQTAESTRTALAATSRVKRLFPNRLADLSYDESWTEVARRVRTHTAATIAAGDYPFGRYYDGERVAVDRVAAKVFDLVFRELLAGRDTRVITRLWLAASPVAHFADRAVEISEEERLADPSGDLESLLEDICEVIGALVDHRLRISPADQAGRRLAAPSSGFDLAAWARQVRMSPIGKSDEDLLAFHDMEVGLYISNRNGAVVVEKTSRSSRRWLVGSFCSDEDAVRFLVMFFGSDWRAQANLRRISSRDAAPGTELEDGPTAVHLTWLDGWAEFPNSIGGRNHACDFSRVVGLPLERIAALYESPKGLPPPSPPHG